VNAGIIGGGSKMLSGVNGGGFGGPMPGLGFPPNLGGLPGFPGGPRPPGFREDTILSKSVYDILRATKNIIKEV
jgi:hypothetical protein